VDASGGIPRELEEFGEAERGDILRLGDDGVEEDVLLGQIPRRNPLGFVPRPLPVVRSGSLAQGGRQDRVLGSEERRFLVEVPRSDPNQIARVGSAPPTDDGLEGAIVGEHRLALLDRFDRDGSCIHDDR